jgi:hypothetical protein
VSLISYSAALHKLVMSAAFAAGFGFCFGGKPGYTLPYAAFDTVHMIHLHGQHALPKAIS